MSQGAYTFQIFLEKEQMDAMPTVQQLLDMSCLSGDLKFEEVSPCSSFYKRNPLFVCFLSSETLSYLSSDAVLSNSPNAKVWEQV